MPTTNPVPPRYLGTQVARLLVAGLVGEARALARRRLSWRVAELRAIVGACRYARDHYGAPVEHSDLLFPATEAEQAEIDAAWLRSVVVGG